MARYFDGTDLSFAEILALYSWYKQLFRILIRLIITLGTYVYINVLSNTMCLHHIYTHTRNVTYFFGVCRDGSVSFHFLL